MIGTSAPSTIPAASACAKTTGSWPACCPLQDLEPQDIGSASDRRDNLLERCRLGADRIVQCERAIQQGADDLSAISHFAQSGSFNDRGHLGADCFHRAQDGHSDLRDTHGMRQADRILDDVNLVVQRRRNVDRCVIISAPV